MWRRSALLATLLFASIRIFANGVKPGGGIRLHATVNANTGHQERMKDTDDIVLDSDVVGRRLQIKTPVSQLTNDNNRKDMRLFIEPGNGTFSPTGMPLISCI